MTEFHRGLAGRALPALLLAAAAATQEPAPFAERWAALERDFHAACAESRIVGASAAFVHEDRIAAAVHHGQGDLDTSRPADLQTIWHWASITKTFTGVALMQLRDRGRIGLEDPIVKHVPELAKVHDPDGFLPRVTLVHLLTHSAGFRAGTWPWGGEPWHPHEPTEWSQLVAMFPYTRLEFAPGAKWSYSNPGIVFLGQVIERQSGDDFEVYVDKNVLKPLGMFDSYFDGTPWHLRRRRANNYRIVDGKPVPEGIDFDTGITTSNGGLNAPIADMVRWLRFLLGSLPPPDGAEPVLAAATLREMWQPRLVCSERDGQKESMGLAFFVLERGGRTVYTHTGGQKNFVSFVFVDPRTRTAGIAAYNTNGAGTGPIMQQLRARMIDELLPLFEPR
jgi:CubicO group peptidase (beta-lactamase class C family)